MPIAELGANLGDLYPTVYDEPFELTGDTIPAGATINSIYASVICDEITGYDEGDVLGVSIGVNMDVGGVGAGFSAPDTYGNNTEYPAAVTADGVISGLYHVTGYGCYAKNVAMLANVDYTANTPPEGANDAFETAYVTPLEDYLYGYDAESNPLLWEVGDNPLKGDVDIDPDTGAFTYTPAANEFGEDSFTYTVYDGYDYSDPYTITVTIIPDTVTIAELANTDTCMDSTETPVAVPDITVGTLVYVDEESTAYIESLYGTDDIVAL